MAQENPKTERACDRCRERRVKGPVPGPSLMSDSVNLSPGTRHRSRSLSIPGLAMSLLPQKAVTSQAQSEGAILPMRDDLHELSADSFGPVPGSILIQDRACVSVPSYEPDVNEPWDEGTFDPEWFNLEPDTFYGVGGNSCGFLPNLPNIVDEVDKKSLGAVRSIESVEQLTGISSLPERYMLPGFSDGWTFVDLVESSNIWASESQFQTSAIITDEREHEMAYLIRHFTESIGPWMDLFDQERHFGHLVPLKALRDALLRNAVAAVAAKQLGLLKGRKPFVGTQAQKPAAMEVINVLEVDWFYKAANYYDKAITFSRAYLSALSGSLGSPPTPTSQTTVSGTTSDDLLVAVSIFSLYESLDKLETGWLQHLTGLKSLLSAVGASHDNRSPGQLVSLISHGRQAAFWNFARADYQAAYANHRKTLLDPQDMNLWRDCGLQLQDDGTLYAIPSDIIKSDLPRGREIAQLVSHTVLWLVLNVMNYLVNDLNEPSDTRLASWKRLSLQLDSWESNLPETFQPCAQMQYQYQHSSKRSTKSRLREVFFSINQCAAAVQLYHFARILLLLNKPSINVGLSRLKAYREVSTEAIKHAHEICGIALGRPHPSVRVEMVLPLYIAGTCLEDDDERMVVLDLLKAIEKDTGCASDAKVQSLIAEWGWSKEPQEVP
nr:hypothetical protein CFP56_33666 [Quercus suber]